MAYWMPMTLWSTEKTYVRQKPSSRDGLRARRAAWVLRQLLADSCGCSPDRYFAAGMANLTFWAFVSVAPTVTEAVCVPSLSCQAVIS